MPRKILQIYGNFQEYSTCINKYSETPNKLKFIICFSALFQLNNVLTNNNRQIDQDSTHESTTYVRKLIKIIYYMMKEHLMDCDFYEVF